MESNTSEDVAGEVASNGLDRRAALRAALGGAAAAAVLAGPAVESFSLVPGYAAAASGTASTSLFKAAGGSSPMPANVCTNGAGTTTARGTVQFTRSGTPAQICATITLSTGQSSAGRLVTIYQSNAVGCVGSTTAGTFGTGTGPYTFCVPVLPGATHFVVTLTATSGSGNDDTASGVVNLP